MRVTGLSEGALQAAAGSTSFVRGEDYVRYVHGLLITDSGASASIQARNVYLVDLQWAPRVSGYCTCSHHAAGNFCKHLVAVGLAVLESTGSRQQVAGDEARPTTEPDPLELMDAPALRKLIRDLQEVAPEVARLVELKGAGMLNDDPAASARLVDVVNAALRVRGSVDYRRSFDLAEEIQRVLDELDELVAQGHTRVVQAPLLRAVTRLRTIVERADDSAGVLGDACQRAGELYAAACRAGHPEPTKLARWLLKFRDTSPGWPQLELADFVAAFDDKALRVYRAGVADLEKKYDGADAFGRFELDRMRLELADHDGDVDLAVALLSERAQHTQYAAIVERLRAAGRDAEASEWIDRAVAAGRVSGRMAGQRNDFWLDPADVVVDLLGRGRADDAIEVLRAQVRVATDIRPYRALLDFADPLVRRAEEEAWAKTHLRERAREPHGNGALLVQIAIAEKDLAQAWAVADEVGAGHSWETLANASTADFPARAARLHREKVEDALKIADSSRYPEIAASLARIRDLMKRAGERDEFAVYLGELRETYRRRPALMAALDRRGLR